MNFPADRLLPDIVLVDLGAPEPVIVFMEVVASEGPVTDMRQEALIELATAAGFARRQLAFVTAYLHRDHPAVRRTLAELAWQSFAWFASEPDSIVAMIGTRHGRSLGDLL